MMSQKRTVPRYAHSEGHTDVCYSEDGKYIITCGSEGDVRIWHGIDDDDPKAVCVGDSALSVAQKGDKLYVGSDHNNVQIFTFPDAELDGILTRFTAPVTTIDISRDGSLVAAGSADMEIHLVETTSSLVKHFVGHRAPILHVAIDPKMEYIASSSCDGTVKLWDIGDQKIMKEWTDVTVAVNSLKLAETLCHLSWEPLTGRLLAIPFSLEIKVFQRSTWNLMMTMLDNRISTKYSLTCWSSCGRFLAASSRNGEISVWNSMINRITSFSNDDNHICICSLRWNPLPDQRQLAFCDIQGQLVVVDDCYPTTNESKSENLNRKAADLKPENEFVRPDINVNFEEDDDPETISLEKIKANYSGFLEDDQGSSKTDDDDDLTSIKSVSARDPVLPIIELQSAFQPTSTPKHLQRRFMVFNDVGYVRQTNTEDENMIDVDFHDASIHHAFRINNLLNHSMAALNAEALVLACEKTEHSASKLVCVLFKSWDSSKEWSIEMIEEEDIQAVTVGGKWLAAVTNFRFLRIFTLSGIQREILRLPGSIVCLNASDDLLYIVYHSAIGLPGEQNLSFAIYQIAVGCTVLVSAQPLPLSFRSTLKWVGFSDQFNPCALDSDGVLNLFVSSSGLWKPICRVDNQGTSNHYFVIGVSEERQNIRCILCKGSYYPSTVPHPFITEIPWQIPICENLVDKGTLEENYWRCSIAKECLKQEHGSLNTEFLTMALKLFSLSCKTGHEMRVFELCEFANQKDVTDLALKYAHKTRNEKLAERLTHLQKTQEEMEMEDKMNNFDLPKPRPLGSRNIDQHDTNDDKYQSQELFPEMRSSTGSSIEPSQDSVSLIAETKKRKSLAEQKHQILGSRKINPFKKSSQLDASMSTPTQESKHLSMTTSEVKTIVNGTFSAWYDSHKENFMKEFPDLDESEVARLAAKKYRLLRKSQEVTGSNKEVDSKNVEKEQNSGNKRKNADDEFGEQSAQKRRSFLKLQEFLYKK